MKERLIFFVLIAFALLSGCNNADKHKSFNTVDLNLISIHAEPIIKAGDPGTENNKFGFEGGTAYKVNGVYYILSTEVWHKPKQGFALMARWFWKCWKTQG